MIRTNTLAAAFVAASLGTAAIATPAAAGGQVSLSFAPTSQEEADALRAGLTIYAIANGIKNGSIKQFGSGNSAGLAQNGSGNLGIVHQEGHGHDGTLQQNGNGNAYGLFQFGRNTSGNVVQNGDGNAGATFQFGW